MATSVTGNISVQLHRGFCCRFTDPFYTLHFYSRLCFYFTSSPKINAISVWPFIIFKFFYSETCKRQINREKLDCLCTFRRQRLESNVSFANRFSYQPESATNHKSTLNWKFILSQKMELSIYWCIVHALDSCWK